MWIANDDCTVLVNSDNVAYLFIARYDENIVIRASMKDGHRVTLRKLPPDNEPIALHEFNQMRGLLERDHQRRWRY